MMGVSPNEKALRKILWFALAGVAVSSIYLEWAPVPGRIMFGGILGGLAGLAYSASKKGAVIGAWIGGVIGAAIVIDGIFHPIIAFGLSFQWYQLLILPFGVVFGIAIGSIIGATMGWFVKAMRRLFHGR